MERQRSVLALGKAPSNPPGRGIAAGSSRRWVPSLGSSSTQAVTNGSSESQSQPDSCSRRVAGPTKGVSNVLHIPEKVAAREAAASRSAAKFAAALLLLVSAAGLACWYLSQYTGYFDVGGNSQANEGPWRWSSIEKGKDGETSETHSSLEVTRSGLHTGKEPSVAICLAGGLRSFELTWPSIERHLLSSFHSPIDLFIHTPVDNDTRKLTMLAPMSPHVRHVSIRMVTQEPLDEAIAALVLKRDGSPNGLQGLLHYFHLVEGCETMISEHEALRRRSPYQHVIRTRPDSFWFRAPSLALSALPPNSYVAPAGCRYHGVNDRFATMTRKVAAVALRRLSALLPLQRANHSGLNSETALLSALSVERIQVIERNLPFCVLTGRVYAFGENSPLVIPIASLTHSTGELNGAKCRPCRKPLHEGRDEGSVRALLRQQVKPFAAINQNHVGVRLCNGSRGLDQGWEAVFDEFVGTEAAHARREIASRNPSQCVADWKALLTIPSLTVSYTGSSTRETMIAAVCHDRAWNRQPVLSMSKYAKEWLQIFVNSSVIVRWAQQLKKN